MRRRADLVHQTRQRITEAAVRLHTTVGPSAASMSAVAEEAGVTRLTLYRHFPSRDALFGACMSHWRAAHPPPDPEAWRGIEDFDARVGTALGELYRWFGENGDDLYPIYRDAAYTPASNQRARQANNNRMVEAIVHDVAAPGAAKRRLRATVGHVIGYWTWRSLAIDQGLSTREASALVTEFVVGAAAVASGRAAAAEAVRQPRRGSNGREGPHRAGRAR
jgi:AcrR family transcriptional regulator